MAEDVKKELRRPLTSSLRRNARAWTIQSGAESVAARTIFLGALVAVGVSPYVAARYGSLTLWQWFVALAAYFVLVPLAVAFAFLAGSVSLIEIRRRYMMLWIVTVTIGYLVVLIRVIELEFNHLAKIIIVASLICASCIIIGSLFVGIMSGFVILGLVRTHRKRESHANLVEALLYLVWRLDQRVDRLKTIEARRELTQVLELAAQSLDAWTLRDVTCGDSRTDEWVRSELKQIAEAFRAKKKIVLFGDQKTITRVKRELSRALQATITGRMDRLERVPVEERSDLLGERRNWKTYLSAAAHALLPLAVLSALRFSPLRIENPVIDYAFAVAGLWAIVRILIAVDPEYQRHLAAARMVGDFVASSRHQLQARGVADLGDRFTDQTQ